MIGFIIATTVFILFVVGVLWYCSTPRYSDGMYKKEDFK